MSQVQNTAGQIEAEKQISPLKQQFKEFWFYFSENKGAVAGLFFFLFVVFVAIFADIIAPHSPNQQYREFIQLPPFWQDGGQFQFFLGTDPVGRDVLSRIMHGSRYSLFAGCIVIVISLTAGVLLGLSAGFFRGFYEVVVMRVMDVILSIPSLLMALVLVAMLGPSLQNAMIAISITYLPHYVRLARASTVAEAARDYVMASKVAGAGKMRLMLVAILPNCMAPLIVQASLSFSTAILDTAALGFLGQGAQAPTAEWGTMLADAREFILSAWWIVTFPGLAILLTVLAINLMGDGLRDALDPKMKRS
ncbi:peptide transporter [Kiloniella spongiae]|uniref:Peptide transporter n=1 Tax=Kiloniella spongiae TaxID=1489064 RepID=A0A0H2MDG3_9PROT|nr:ABC transporter permease subunit [Kiloniella spongiae]KLN60266.1 peptide transporter [Kiloniella spongiae]